MQVEIKGDNLVISIPLAKPYSPSKSGKTRIVATSKGIVTTNVMVEGRALSIGLNAFIDIK